MESHKTHQASLSLLSRLPFTNNSAADGVTAALLICQCQKIEAIDAPREREHCRHHRRWGQALNDKMMAKHFPLSAYEVTTGV